MNSPNRLLHRQQIENQFDRAASTYDGTAKLQRRMGNMLLQRIVDLGIEKTSRLMDLGCGTGELLSQLQASGFSDLTGLDLSAKMISVAKEKAPTASFVHADIEAIPGDGDRFGVVASNAAIQWCDTETATREIARILRPGGMALLTSFVAGTLAQWHQAFLAGGYESRVHALASAVDLQSALSHAGLAIEEVQTFVETATFDSIESMFASVRHIGATNAMSSRKRAMTRSEYNHLKLHFQDRLESDGTLELDYVWVQIVAKKMAPQ